MKKFAPILLLCLLATFLQAQNISSYSIITTGSVLKGGANGKIVLTQPMYEKLVAEQSALKSNETDKLSSAVKVYPNPFIGTVTLTADMKEEGRVQVKIYNMLGAKVWDGITDNFLEGINEHTIDLKGLKAGMYFMKTATEKGNAGVTVKLIKQ